MVAKNFRSIERAALADPKRRANIERERKLLLRAIKRGRQIDPPRS